MIPKKSKRILVVLVKMKKGIPNAQKEDVHFYHPIEKETLDWCISRKLTVHIISVNMLLIWSQTI